eukprot:scaffold814_cov100-Cylindrotheca_fusiformis.AAC.1
MSVIQRQSVMIWKYCTEPMSVLPLRAIEEESAIGSSVCYRDDHPFSQGGVMPLKGKRKVLCSIITFS